MGSSITLFLPLDDDNRPKEIDSTRDFKSLFCTFCQTGSFEEHEEFYDLVQCNHCGFKAPRFSTKKEHLVIIDGINDKL
jgi:DNA-directed RNA polymerase subunit RPC12/RpoP